jgi:thiamine pyrophosphate-dependent acetolactate synthase large subunit-like protein
VKRADVIDAFATVRGDAAVITGPGASSGMLYVRDHQPATIYNMELGYATAMCLGIALGDPSRRVVVIEGDGSLTAELQVLTTIARYVPRNLVVLAMDNGIYGTGGGTVRTAAGGSTDLAAVARACGIDSEHVVEVADAEEARGALQSALGAPGPWIVVAHVDAVDASTGPKRARPKVDIVESASAMRHALEERRPSA